MTFSLCRSFRYGISYSVSFLDSSDFSNSSIFLSSKWLFSRWQLHGVSNTFIETSFTRVKDGQLLVYTGGLAPLTKRFRILEFVFFGRTAVNDFLSFFKGFLFSFFYLTMLRFSARRGPLC